MEGKRYDLCDNTLTQQYLETLLLGGLIVQTIHRLLQKTLHPRSEMKTVGSGKTLPHKIMEAVYLFLPRKSGDEIKARTELLLLVG